MDLSVIIVSYNTKNLLDDCLESLLAAIRGSDISSQVIVVDNVSIDGTREMLAKKYPEITTILNNENVGFGRANNQGIYIAKGDYVLLLNSDTVVPSDSIAKLYHFAVKHSTSFVGPKLLNLDGSTQTSCGPFFSLWVVFAALFLKGDVIGLTRWSPRTTKIVDWISGACVMAPKKLFSDNLLFDEGIFMYMEEIDLFMRAKKKGYATYFYPGSRIIHLGSGSSKNKRTGPVLNIYKGLLYIYKKHYSKAACFMLYGLLKLKAALSVIIGILIGNRYLKTTYGQAYKLV